MRRRRSRAYRWCAGYGDAEPDPNAMLCEDGQYMVAEDGVQMIVE